MISRQNVRRILGIGRSGSLLFEHISSSTFQVVSPCLRSRCVYGVEVETCKVMANVKAMPQIHRFVKLLDGFG